MKEKKKLSQLVGLRNPEKLEPTVFLSSKLPREIVKSPKFRPELVNDSDEDIVIKMPLKKEID
jgi:hypothetical protein